MTRRIATIVVALLGLLPAAAGAHSQGPERPVVFVSSSQDCEATFARMKAAIQRLDFELGDGKKRGFKEFSCLDLAEASAQNLPRSGMTFARYAAHVYRDEAIDVVAEGPAGLAVRHALGMNGREGWPRLDIEDAVTIGTPHDQMTEFPHPDGKQGTDWSVIGSDDDEITGADSAIAMAADHKTTYLDPGLTHHGLLNDVSTKKDAAVVFQHGEDRPRLSKKAKHPALRVADDLVFGRDRGLTACRPADPDCKDTIVFIPGFGGSELWCENRQLWPPLGTNKEGRLAALLPGSRCEPDYGVVWDHEYRPAELFLKQNFKDFNVVYFPWNWTKSPGASVERPRGQRRPHCEVPPQDAQLEPEYRRTCLEPLDDVIDRIRSENEGGRVILYAHSAGGLVARWYVNDPRRARKVSRVLIAGTPFHGTPKALLPLAYGTTGDKRTDGIIRALELTSPLRRLARESAGTYHVLPSTAYGDFSIRQLDDGSLTTQTVTQSRSIVTAVGGSSALYRAADMDHKRRLDQLRPIKNVDLQVIAARGEPTLAGFKVRRPEPDGADHLDSVWGDGDGTVPIWSAEAGHLPPPDGKTGVRTVDDVKVHEVCATHASLQGSVDESAYSGPVKDFLATGKPLAFEAEECRVDGNAVTVQEYGILTTPAAQRATVRPAGSSGPAMSLDQAIDKGLVDAFDTGQELTITTSDRRPVTLALPQSRAAVRVTRITADGQGEDKTYLSDGPGLRIATGPEPVVANRAGPIAPAAADDTAPQTTVSVRRSGRSVIARARASDASGVTGTWYQIGRGRRHAWRGRLKLPLRQARRVRFYSVDTFDNVEKPKRLPLR